MNTRYRFLHICKVLELLLHLLDKISPYLTSRDPEIGHFFLRRGPQDGQKLAKIDEGFRARKSLGTTALLY